MTDLRFVRMTAPTLAGMKTGSLFRCCFDSKQEFLRELREKNHVLLPKGMRLIPLNRGEHSALLYLYRPSRLTSDLANQTARQVLRQYGYPDGNLAQVLSYLKGRIVSEESFPHEIGLFLSYPPEDVCGFMEGKTPVCTGCWQVYGNAEKAQKQFQKYHRCTEIYEKQIKKGKTIGQLAVAAR